MKAKFISENLLIFYAIFHLRKFYLLPKHYKIDYSCASSPRRTVSNKCFIILRKRSDK